MKNIFFILSMSLFMTNCATNSKYSNNSRIIASKGIGELSIGRLQRVVRTNPKVADGLLAASKIIDAGANYKSLDDVSIAKQNEVFYKILNDVVPGLNKLDLRQALKNYINSSDADAAVKNAFKRTESKVASQLSADLFDKKNAMEAALFENLIKKLSASAADDVTNDIYYMKAAFDTMDSDQIESFKMAWLSDLEARTASDNQLSAMGPNCGKIIVSKDDVIVKMNHFVATSWDPSLPLKENYIRMHIFGVANGLDNDSTRQAAVEAYNALAKLSDDTKAKTLNDAYMTRPGDRTPAQKRAIENNPCGNMQNVVKG